jgi:hypothetical protein
MTVGWRYVVVPAWVAEPGEPEVPPEPAHPIAEPEPPGASQLPAEPPDVGPAPV